MLHAKLRQCWRTIQSLSKLSDFDLNTALSRMRTARLRKEDELQTQVRTEQDQKLDMIQFLFATANMTTLRPCLNAHICDFSLSHSSVVALTRHADKSPADRCIAELHRSCWIQCPSDGLSRNKCILAATVDSASGGHHVDNLDKNVADVGILYW